MGEGAQEAAEGQFPGLLSLRGLQSSRRRHKAAGGFAVIGCANLRRLTAKEMGEMDGICSAPHCLHAALPGKKLCERHEDASNLRPAVDELFEVQDVLTKAELALNKSKERIIAALCTHRTSSPEDPRFLAIAREAYEQVFNSTAMNPADRASAEEIADLFVDSYRQALLRAEID